MLGYLKIEGKVGSIKLMNWQVNKMTSRWNDESMKWRVDEMMSQWNDESMKGRVDEMTSWQNDDATKWWVDEMMSQQHNESMKWQVDEMSQRQSFLFEFTFNLFLDRISIFNFKKSDPDSFKFFTQTK